MLVPRSVPLLYGAAVALLVAAGVVLSARTAATTSSAGQVPQDCATVPRQLVEELFPGTTLEPADHVTEDGVRYARWMDAEGTLLVELRCARASFGDVIEHQRLLERAERQDGPELLGTTPDAVVAAVPEGVVIRQLDEASQLELAWFVRDDLDAAAAREVVERTGSRS